MLASSSQESDGMNRMLVGRTGAYIRAILSFVTAAGISLALATVVLAVCCGNKNGEDINCCGWIGTDAPGAQGTYAYVNATHNMILSEWDEPSHDWVRNQQMTWTQLAEDKLDAETNTRTLTYEIRIHDQFYYNFTGGWNTNLPWSKGAEGENAFEELAQGYTEVDLEQVDPWRINFGAFYFFDAQFDNEKAAINGLPDFWSEIEYCNKDFASNCNFDETGFMNKKVLQR